MKKDGLNNNIGAPLWLLAELTYACPLQCPYCSNPIEFAKRNNELTTVEWRKLIEQARELGAVQLGFSGGEPLVRRDLEEIILHAHQLGFYTNLVTSSVGMTTQRVLALKQAGLDSIQISLQASTQVLNDYFAHAASFQQKIAMARAVKAAGFPLVLNFVLHRHNIDFVESILDLGLQLNADYIELANTQYYGFALHNRDYLLPTQQQVERAEMIAHQYRDLYQDKTRIYYVVPDYYENRPKACMNGWGNIFMTITPDGYALPCHSARIIPDLQFPSVRENDLRWIWQESPLFNQFRGLAWMPEPCRSCPDKYEDFGGCRCQAFLLTEDSSAADPVCHLSPHHDKIVAAINKVNINPPSTAKLMFRNPKNSKLVAKGD